MSTIIGKDENGIQHEIPVEKPHRLLEAEIEGYSWMYDQSPVWIDEKDDTVEGDGNIEPVIQKTPK